MSELFDEENFRKKIDLLWPKNFNNKKKLSDNEISRYFETIIKLLKEKNGVLIAHYYTNNEIQKLAEISGGFVGDSLEMARFGQSSNADIIVVAGVRFMGETAKILSPKKKILMPEIKAECSLDLGCEADEFENFCKQYPDHEIVVYANTSAKVKALADWVVTSSIAVELVEYLSKNGKKIVWAPDRYLGSYIKNRTDADMKIWQSYCIVHSEFSADAILKLKESLDDVAVLVHPESHQDVISIADVVGSTSQLLRASHELSNKRFIVATESGIFYKMKLLSPNKEFIKAPTLGENATCYCCSMCPWMKMNSLESIVSVLENDDNKNNQILVSEDIISKAIIPLNRMIEWKR